jgi:hypothetical protein
MNPFRKAAVAAALVGSTVAGGAIGAAFVSGSATADTSSSSTTTPAAATAPAATTPAAGQPPQGGNFDPTKGGHMANGITEALLTGDTADKVKAAALAAVPGGTIQRVENDAEGSPYEAHMTKSDGTQVTVKVDSNFKVTTIVNGAG